MATPTRPRAAAPTPHRDEQTVYGVKAALALLQHRPADVRRIFHGPALRSVLGPHLAAAAARHVPYRELDGEGLRKVADTAHHEGLVVVAAPLRWGSLAPGLAAAAGPHALWLALDRVENPHNLGAIVRTAAFFGVSGVLAGGVQPGTKVNAAVLRVAEGGAELVPLLAAGTLPQALAGLRDGGCRVIGLEPDGPLPLPEAGTRGLTAGPLALVLGQEREGLSTPVRRACDALCALVGGGPLSSLNVSVSAGVALAEVTRGRPAASPLPRPLPAGAGESAAERPAQPGSRPSQRRGSGPRGRDAAGATRAKPPGRRAPARRQAGGGRRHGSKPRGRTP